MREYFYCFYGWILPCVPRQFDNGCEDPSRLHLRDQLLGGSPANRIRYRIEWRKTRNRGVVVGRDDLICADSFASSICLFRTPAITVAPRDFAVNTAERPTFRPGAYDENRLAAPSLP